jgi:capsular exopolysaccharide synthesis family protein
VGLAFLFEYLDNSIKTFEDVEKYTGLPSLGIIPAFYPTGQPQKFKVTMEGTGDKKEEKEPPATEAVPPITAVELIAHYSPKSNISENYRSIRTTLFLSSADAKLKALIISSPLPQEGKTATISNLGVTLAQADKRVVIIDCDLRKPRLHKIFKMKNLNGVTNYLSEGIDLRQLVKPTLVPNLYLINAGPVPPNPVELLGSERMAYLIDTLKKHFDYVLFDTPPILAVSDAIAMGPHIDGVILVAWGGKTPRDALKRAAEKLETHKIKCLGVIINNIDVEGPDYNFLRQYYKFYEHQ